ncbi:MAG: 1-deoxy-D-xylulose-5-phosphate reductoisomerase [Christensenellales bacterium]
MKKISILGSTGSIGRQALDIINSDEIDVVAIACGRNIELLSEQIERFKPNIVSVEREEDAKALSTKYSSLEVLWGKEGLNAVAECDADLLLNGIMGMVGLEPTYKAILSGKDIALANKETLVAGGKIIMEAARDKGIEILPVDSEHSAIYQCLNTYRNPNTSENVIRRIILTASGGPFRGYSIEELRNVTLQDALNHPNWSMGKKITVDSATMMNKGLEVIEAKWLFDVDFNKIDVHVHPQSIIHSAVEFIDGSIIAQMGMPDMRVPISYAINYGERKNIISASSNGSEDKLDNNMKFTDLFEIGNLTFEKPDMSTFKCLAFAYAALEEGKSYPAVLNSANEALVDLFLNEKIQFIDIQNNLESFLEKHQPVELQSIDEIKEMDREVKEKIRRGLW